MHYLKYNHEEKNRLSQWSPGHQLGRAPRCTAQDGPWVIWMLWFCVFFSEDPMSIRCFTVITRVLLNKPHISESLFFCPRSWNGFIKPKIGIPLVQIQPIRIPLSPTLTVRKFLEQLALMLCILLIESQTSSWFLDKMLGKAPCLTEGYPYNGNSY